MKSALIGILLSIIPLFSLANEIDNLKTTADVESFIHKLSFWGKDSGMYDEENMAKLIINPDNYGDEVANQQIAKKLGIKEWQKTDLNNDGRTDLIAFLGFKEDGECLWVAVLDHGDKYYLHTIAYSNYSPNYFVSVKTVKNTPEILLYEYSGEPGEKRTYVKTTTLVCKFNELVELQGNNDSHIITKIDYALMGRWRGHRYNLSISANGTWRCKQVRYPKDTISYSGKIDVVQKDELLSLLNYINFSKLDTNYSTHSTDQEYCELLITYDNGKTKKIGDYGLEGTYGLKAVYNKFWNLARVAIKSN